MSVSVCPGKTHVLWHQFSRNSLPQNWLTVKLKQHQRRTFGLRAPLCKFRRPGLESWLPIFLANYYKGEKNGWIYLLLNKIGVNSRCTKCFQENLGNIKPEQRSLAIAAYFTIIRNPQTWDQSLQEMMILVLTRICGDNARKYFDLPSLFYFLSALFINVHQTVTI